MPLPHAESQWLNLEDRGTACTRRLLIGEVQVIVKLPTGATPEQLRTACLVVVFELAYHYRESKPAWVPRSTGT